MKDRNYAIYKVENIETGEIYIGATTNSLYQRKLDHQERANRGETNKFHEAINTFGLNAFKWEQIDTANSTDELALKEKQYVLKYNAKEDGYNSDSGGGIKKTIYQYSITDGCLLNTYECLEDAAISVGAYKNSIGNACNGQNKTCKGYYWSYEFNEAFVPEIDRRKKAVKQFNLEDVLIEEYSSVSEASLKSGLSKTSISRVCRGERESAGGFKWKY